MNKPGAGYPLEDGHGKISSLMGCKREKKIILRQVNGDMDGEAFPDFPSLFPARPTKLARGDIVM
jgi:hypothetical protein